MYTFEKVKPVKHTKYSKNVVPKGQRRNWSPLGEVKPVLLTSDITIGKVSQVRFAADTTKAKLFVP